MSKRFGHSAHKLNLDRKAEKMMEEVRIKNIEREHRSVGALLDQRTLKPLVVPRQPRMGSTLNREISERDLSRRDVVETTVSVDEDALGAQRGLIEEGLSVVAVDNYENEELIWATKSRDPAYSQKRKYYHKDLQDFKDNMTAEQKLQFRRLTHEKLVEIANKYRVEMAYMKEEMDLAAVFHPDANAHRVHCMYIMKLYKGIRSDTVEDPVLRRLRDEELAKKKAAEEEERKQRELLESIENKTRGIKVSAAAAAVVVPAPSASAASAIPAPPQISSSPQQHFGKKDAKLKPGKITRAKIAKSLAVGELPPTLKRSQTLPAPLPLAAATTTTGLTDSSLNRNTATLKSIKADKASPDIETVLADTILVPTVEDAEVHIGNDHKLFTKIKRGKLGGSDPSAILLEEASRLERSEVLSVKKTRERSSLVDNEMTSWMLSLLQSNQIEKTAQGRDVVPSTIDLFAASLAASDGGDADEGSVFSPNKASLLPNDLPSSQRMIPFGEFYDMFRTYSAEAKERKEKEREKERRRLEKESKRNKHHQDGEHHALSGVVDDHHNKSAGDLSQSQNESIEDQHHHQHLFKRHAPLHNPHRHDVVEVSDPEAFVEPPEKIDLVDIMKDSDPNFEEYYKMMLRQKPQGAKLFKGAGTKIPKLRAMAPLGKSAVTITDTKGNEKAISSKGFYNLFSTRKATDDSTHQDAITVHTQTSDDKTHDDESIIERRTKDNSTLTETEPLTPSFPDASPPASSPGTERRTPSPSNARRSRNRSRGKKTGSRGGLDGSNAIGGGADGGFAAAGAAYGPDPDFQTKLVCVWDCLQMPALQRLAFMRKYASKAFAAELTRATDMWAEAAVLTLAKLYLVERNKQKVREGYAVLPLLAQDLLVGFLETVPKILSSEAHSLCFQASENSSLSKPLSAVVLERVEQALFNCIPSLSDDPAAARTQVEASQQLDMLGDEIQVLLTRSVAVVHEELSDVVTFNGEPVIPTAPVQITSKV